MFKIGQKVICIKNHSQGLVQKDRVYFIRGIKNNPCCGAMALDVGITTNYKYEMCWQCQEILFNNSNIYWFGSHLFRPLEEEKGEATIEDFISISDEGKSILEIMGEMKELIEKTKEWIPQKH